MINHNSTYTNADSGKYKYICEQAETDGVCFSGRNGFINF